LVIYSSIYGGFLVIYSEINKKPIWGAGDMKKFLVVVLVVTLLSGTFIVGSVSAANHSFNDIERLTWAHSSIEKMFYLGVTTGRSSTVFAPLDPVTQLETIVMFVRLLGYNEEYIKSRELPQSLASLLSVPAWATGHVSIALEIGLLPQSEIMNFRATTPALRHQVAVMAIRAMGLEDKAKGMRNIDLSILSFTDLATIPSESRPYVQIAVEEGIITGMPGNKFAPMDNINRAAMMAILDRVHKKGIPLKTKETLGAVKDVDVDGIPSITIVDKDGKESYFQIDNRTSVFKGGSRITLSQLAQAKYAYVINSSSDNSKAVFIEYLEALPAGLDINIVATDRKTVTGIFRSIANNKVVLSVGAEQKEYILDIIFTVEINGASSKVSDLIPGFEVRLSLVEEKVTKISNSTTISKINSVVKGKTNGIQITDRTLTVNEFSKFTKNYAIGTINNVAVGDYISATIQNNRVIKLDAHSPYYTITGKVVDVDVAGSKFTVFSDAGNEIIVNVGTGFTISRDSKEIKLENVMKYDKATLFVIEGKVAALLAQASVWEREGSVVEIRKTTKNMLTLEFAGGIKEELEITENVKVTKDGKTITLFDLNSGDQVILKMFSDMIIGIEVMKAPVAVQLEGLVTIADIAKEQITLRIGTTDRIINLTKDTIVIREGRMVSTDQIKGGNMVVVFAKELHDKTLRAETIVIK
jgi:hypothetical protein